MKRNIFFACLFGALSTLAAQNASAFNPYNCVLASSYNAQGSLGQYLAGKLVNGSGSDQWGICPVVADNGPMSWSVGGYGLSNCMFCYTSGTSYTPNCLAMSAVGCPWGSGGTCFRYSGSTPRYNGDVQCMMSAGASIYYLAY